MVCRKENRFIFQETAYWAKYLARFPDWYVYMCTIFLEGILIPRLLGKWFCKKFFWYIYAIWICEVCLIIFSIFFIISSEIEKKGGNGIINLICLGSSCFSYTILGFWAKLNWTTYIGTRYSFVKVSFFSEQTLMEEDEIKDINTIMPFSLFSILFHCHFLMIYEQTTVTETVMF